jgi:hypothetical protein
VVRRLEGERQVEGLTMIGQGENGCMVRACDEYLRLSSCVRFVLSSNNIDVEPSQSISADPRLVVVEGSETMRRAAAV